MPAVVVATQKNAEHPALDDYYLLPATRAELLTQVGRIDEARSEYSRALERRCTEPERRFLMFRLNRL